MAINYFIGQTQESLETQLAAAQEELATGKHAASVSVGESSFTFEQELSLTKKIEMLLRALNLLDPDTYPIDQITPTTRARIASTNFR